MSSTPRMTIMFLHWFKQTEITTWKTGYDANVETASKATIFPSTFTAWAPISSPLFVIHPAPSGLR